MNTPVTWITGLFSSVGKDIIGSVTDLIDEVHTSKEEKLILKNRAINAINKGLREAKADAFKHIENSDKERTERLRIDMNSDSWLSKNIRPLTLVFLDVSIVVLAIGTVFNKSITADQLAALKIWIPLFTALLITVHGFYFGSRGVEKVVKVRGANHER